VSGQVQTLVVLISL